MCSKGNPTCFPASLCSGWKRRRASQPSSRPTAIRSARKSASPASRKAFWTCAASWRSLTASAKRRGPDFAVTYRANLVFNIEVARVRVEESGVGGIDLPRKEERILRILLDKLGQMQPGMANLLIIHTREELARAIDLGRIMQEVKTRAERKDASFYNASRYTSPAAFFKDFLHLSGILLWAAETQLWVNKQARPGLAEKVLY